MLNRITVRRLSDVTPSAEPEVVPVYDETVVEPDADIVVDVTEDPEAFDDSDDDDFDDDLDDEFDDHTDDLGEVAEMTQSLESLLLVEHSARLHGVSAGLLAYAQSMSLLDGTALQTLSLESFGDDQSELALEGLAGAVASKIKDWSAAVAIKTGAIFKSISTGISALSMRILKFVGATGSKIKATAKAHPYATGAVVVASVAAVSVAIAAYTGYINGGTIDRVKSSVSSIKWPKKADVKEEGGKALVVYTGPETTDKVKSAAEGGWTVQKLRTLSDALVRASKSVVAHLKDFFSAVVRRGSKPTASPAPQKLLTSSEKSTPEAAKTEEVKRPGTAVVKVDSPTGSDKSPHYSQIWGAVTSVTRMIHSVVMHALTWMMQTARSLVSRGPATPVSATPQKLLTA